MNITELNNFHQQHWTGTCSKCGSEIEDNRPCLDEHSPILVVCPNCSGPARLYVTKSVTEGKQQLNG